jgi:hypothetical protein
MRIFAGTDYGPLAEEAKMMKERLNLTIDGALLEAMKTYAASKEMSVSELVESYFRSVTKPVQRNNILDLVEGLKKPDVEGGGYGF